MTSADVTPPDEHLAEVALDETTQQEEIIEPDETSGPDETAVLDSDLGEDSAPVASSSPEEVTVTDSPIWFRKEAFIVPEFDSAEYVNDLRRYVPLETLRTELDSHLNGLNHELVELINKDYTEFVNLSTKLVDIDGAVVRMRAPLVELKNKLGAAREYIASAVEAIGSGLAKRQEAASVRGVLELMLDTAHVVAKVEKLLSELRGATCGVEAKAHLLERIASEVNRLKFYIARGQGLPFVEGMMPRIKGAEEELSALLQQVLREALDKEDQVVAKHCLLAYAAMDRAGAAEDIVRE
eukprot:gene24130-29286_t